MRAPVPWSTIVLFKHREIREAIAHAGRGGIALHVWVPDPAWAERAPLVFRRNMNRWAHLLDQDRERLVRLVRELGVRTVVVSHEGKPRQHVDLCATPLDRAIARALRLGEDR